jgi:hypothetical protein
MLKIAEEKQEMELSGGKFDSSDFTSHEICNACIVFAVSAFEAHLKDWNFPLTLKAHWLDDVIDQLAPFFGIQKQELISNDELIELQAYIQWRHVIAHNANRADEPFLTRQQDYYQTLGKTFPWELGKEYLFYWKNVSSMLDTLEKLVKQIDDKACAKFGIIEEVIISTDDLD